MCDRGEEIDYPLATFSNFSDILGETLKGGKRLGLVGYWDMPEPILKRIQNAVTGMEIINCDDILYNMRIIKSAAEIECLKECGRIACAGYDRLMAEAVPGSTELEAANVQLKYLKESIIAKEMVRAVKKVFKKHNLEKYDVYPPMHGIGLAEAESPYPDEEADYPFRAGMCVNSDISLFGHPAGSNRIEEGFVIGEEGPVSLTPMIRTLCEKGV